MFALYSLIFCTNSTIVYIIWIHKNLHKPMYIFIAALLLNAVLYSTTVYPKHLIDFLSEKQVTTYSACLFQFFMFYTLGSSEFFLLAAMAYDRYVAICKPLQYQTIMGKTTVSIFLAVAWLVPACHIVVLTAGSAEATLCNFNLKGIFCNNAVYTLQCVKSRLITVFGVVALIDLVILPMFFIVFTYSNIFILTYQSCKEVRKKAAETCLPHFEGAATLLCTPPKIPKLPHLKQEHVPGTEWALQPFLAKAMASDLEVLIPTTSHSAANHSSNGERVKVPWPASAPGPSLPVRHVQRGTEGDELVTGHHTTGVL
ncbi:olfactory receptor 2T27-like [Oreochromis aureus]|uniref:olfactory receptor 2T27-like n=1 Tax=Oreochromis aureus TaxID=47969 RepID=UPI0019537A19|nr:olfactory receptor 2T27-like [Oreochromis aureus]